MLKLRVSLAECVKMEHIIEKKADCPNINKNQMEALPKNALKETGAEEWGSYKVPKEYNK